MTNRTFENNVIIVFIRLLVYNDQVCVETQKSFTITETIILIQNKLQLLYGLYRFAQSFIRHAVAMTIYVIVTRRLTDVRTKITDGCSE